MTTSTFTPASQPCPLCQAEAAGEQLPPNTVAPLCPQHQRTTDELVIAALRGFERRIRAAQLVADAA